MIQVVIVQQRPDGRTLVDMAALVEFTGRSRETLRRRCPVAELHIDARGTTRPLYDAQAAHTILAALRRRTTRTRPALVDA